MNPWGSPALRRTAEARTPSSSNLTKVLPETRKCLFMRSLTFERSHVDGEAVLHIRLEQSLVSFVDLLDRDDFDVCGDVMLPGEVEHLLGFGDTADRRTGEAASPHDKAECRDGKRLLRRADERDVAIAAQQIDVSAYVVISGDSVENKIEAAGVLLHLVHIPRDDNLVCSEAECVFLLFG